MVEFGHKLKQIRIQNKMTLEEISFKTKININYLNAIEEGNISQLPEAYLKMFIKTYAKIMSVQLPLELTEKKSPKRENDDTIEESTESDIENDTSPFSTKKTIFNKKNIIRIITNYRNLIFIIFIILLTVIVFTAYNFFFKDDEISHIKEPAIKVITVNSDKNHQISVNVRDSIKISNEVKQQDSLSFKITAIDSSYLLYCKDSKKVKEMMLIPGKKLALKASKLIEVKIGNSRGVELEYGGNKVLKELKNNKKSSAFIKITPQTGVKKVKESKRIQEYLQSVYGIK